MNEEQPNPHKPFRDHWDKQRHDNQSGPVILDYLREHHDRLSALTWEEDKKPRRDDP